MTYTELPYEFDLLYDVKSVEELHSILSGEPHRTDATDWELCELAKKYDIPLPEGYKTPLKSGFPTYVWIDDSGGYITHTPTLEEHPKYQKMVICSGRPLIRGVMSKRGIESIDFTDIPDHFTKNEHPCDMGTCFLCGWSGKISDCEEDQEQDGWEMPVYTVHLCPKCDDGFIDDYFYSGDGDE